MEAMSKDLTEVGTIYPTRQVHIFLQIKFTELMDSKFGPLLGFCPHNPSNTMAVVQAFVLNGRAIGLHLKHGEVVCL